MKKRHELFGFTLVEMMVTVAIVGIIAGIAYPSYMSTIRRSNRAEAKTELMDVAQRMQRCYTAYGRFDDPLNLNRCTVYEQLTGAGNIVTRGRGYYRITISNPAPAPATAATSYTLTATAILQPQLADVDGCNVMTLTSTGIQGPIQAPPAPSTCW